MLNRRNNHSITSYNPFKEMENFSKNFFSSPFSFFGQDSIEPFKTDIKDTGKSYQLEADLPGFRKEDIHIDINDDVLTIQAERHSETQEKDDDGKYLRCERSYGSFQREFDLSAVKADAIKASYKDGVLFIEMPKKEQTISESRHLEIE